MSHGKIHNNGVSHETVVSFSCNSGFKPLGYLQIKCLDGIWNESSPSCIGPVTLFNPLHYHISFLSVLLYHYHYALFLFNSNYTCHLWVIVKCRLSFPLFNKENDIAAYERITTNHSKVILACRACVILAGECLVFSLQKLWPPSLILWQGKAREGKKFAKK